MANNDIDKILEELKRRRARAEGQKPAETVVTRPAPQPEPEQPKPVEKQPEPVVTEPVKEEAPKAEKHILSADGEKTISKFFSDSETGEKKEFTTTMSEYNTKTSEDYIDENFRNFFTQSVIVTKAPDQTSNVEVKRKKGGLFRKRYITDSLTLKVDELEEKQAEKPAKPRPQPKAEPVKQETKPIQPVITKPATRPKASDMAASVKDAQDADSIVRRILGRKRGETPKPATQPAEPDVKVMPEIGDTQEVVTGLKRVEKAQPEVERSTIENVLQPKKEVPSPADDIVDSIYSAVIEQQAKQAIADDQTAYIPVVEENETEREPAEEINEEKTQSIPDAVQQIKGNDVVKMFDAEEEEDEEEDAPFEEYVPSGEFFNKADNESEDIVGELRDFRKTLNLRIVLGIVAGVILTYFALASQSAMPMPGFISPQAQPMMFYIACAVVYAIVLVGFLPTVISGITANGRAPAPDTFVSLGALLSMAQLIMAIVSRNKSNITDITIFAPFMCFALAANAMGKRINTDTILRNLSLANVPDGINAGYIVEDEDAVKRLARTLDEKVPKILVSRKTGAIKNFVNAGFSIHSTDYSARKVALASYGITLLCFALGMLKSGSVMMALCCAAGAAAFMVPLSHTLVNSVPGALMQKNLQKVGALVNGWLGIDQLSKTTHVNFDSKHLFPTGTVTLHGIKTFEKERVDLAILYAASVLIKECDTMKPVFLDVIEGKTDILPEVESCEYYELQGYVAWVQNNRVIIGNRALMNKFDIAMPPESVEARYTQNGRKPVYLAVGGRLFGMFVFSYKADAIVKDNLDKLVERGVSVILSSKDFNIDSALIEEVYGVSGEFINVMNQKEAALLAQFTDYAPETEACVAHLDSLTSLVSSFCSAESCKAAEKVCNLIQTLSVALGAVLALLFTYSQTLPYISILSMILIGFAWMAISTISAFARKY